MMRKAVLWCVVLCLAHFVHGAWTPIGPYGGDIHSIVISPTNGDLIWLMSNEDPAKIVRSIDGGVTWTTLGEFRHLGPLYTDKHFASDPLNDDHLFAVYTEHFFKSMDGGINWTDDSMTGCIFSSIMVHPVDTNVIHGTGYSFDTSSLGYQMAFQQSTDAGETWTYTILNNASWWSFGYDIAISESDPDFIIVCGMTITSIPLIYISTDGGMNFTNVSSSFSTGIQLNAIDINPDNSDIIYAGSSTGIIYRSTDGGITWENDTLTATRLYTIATSQCDPAIVYCSGEPYIYQSTDAGATWTTSDSSLAHSKYYGIATHPSDPNIAYAGCSTGVYKTTDCGASWSLCSNNLNLVTINDFCIAPSAPSTMYVTTRDFGIYKSTNYGTTWSRLPDITNCGNICALAVNPNNPDVVLGLEESG
jgi:photosystem II stability/assembly factor-like uncharacterized protein